MEVPFIPETAHVIHKAPSSWRRRQKETRTGRLHANARVVYVSVYCHHRQMREKDVQPLALFEALSLSSESQVFIELSLRGGPSRHSYSSSSSSSSPCSSLTRLLDLLHTLVISITFMHLFPSPAPALHTYLS